MDIQLGLLARRLSKLGLSLRLLRRPESFWPKRAMILSTGRGPSKGLSSAAWKTPFRFIFWKGKTSRAAVFWSKRTCPGRSWFSKISRLQELNKSTGGFGAALLEPLLNSNLAGIVDRYRLSHYDGCKSSYCTLCAAQPIRLEVQKSA